MLISDMQEKRNKKLAFLLMALTLAAALIIVFGGRERARVDPELFRLADYNSINRISLQSDTTTVELTFKGSRWKVNDRYNADRELVTVLFATLRQAEPKRAVSSQLADSIAERLENGGIHVTLYEDDHVAQQFFAGGNSLKTQAYFRRAGDEQVYMMTIPGYKVYVSGIFELQANQWREKYVFGFNWENFRDLTAEFPGHREDNFTITQDRHRGFGIPDIKTDTGKVHTFLDNVSLLTANEFLEPGDFTDSLKKTTPEMILKITDVTNATYSLALYHAKGSRVAGLLNKTDGVVFSRLKLEPIYRRELYFVEQ